MGNSYSEQPEKLQVYLIIICHATYILFKYDWIEYFKYTFNKATFSYKEFYYYCFSFKECY